VRHSSDALQRIGETKLSSDRPENSVLIPARSSSEANVAELLIDEGYTPFTMLNSGVTEPSFTKCIHDVSRWTF